MATETRSDRILELMYGYPDIMLEISRDNELVNVPVHPSIDKDTLIADDSNPMFVNVEVLRRGVSKTNNRRYNNSIVEQVSGMIPGVQSYLGHPDPSKTSFEFREPHGVFVGSLVQEIEPGVKRAVGKMYVFKSSPLREWIPKCIASGRPLTVSINGVGDVMYGSDVIDVVSMTSLDSIDWANTGTEGMDTSQSLSVVSEMQKNNNGGNVMPDLTAKDVIKNATIAEFKAFNPDGYLGVIKGLTLSELQADNKALYDQIVASAQISEMKLTVDGAEKAVKLDDVQSIIDTQSTKIAELQGDIEKVKISEYKSRKIMEKVPTQFAEKVAGRVTGSTEAEIDASIDTEVTYIREMMGQQAFDNLPVGTNTRKDEGQDDMNEAIKNLFRVKESK